MKENEDALSAASPQTRYRHTISSHRGRLNRYFGIAAEQYAYPLLAEIKVWVEQLGYGRIRTEYP